MHNPVLAYKDTAFLANRITDTAKNEKEQAGSPKLSACPL
jgi:hypothetical protein